MDNVIGIHTSDQSTSFVRMEDVHLNPETHAHESFATRGAFWRELELGAIAPEDSIVQRKLDLTARAKRHDIPKRILKAYIHRSTLAAPRAIGMTVPYAAGPLAREIAGRIFLQAWKHAYRDLQDDLPERIVFLDTPLAIGLSAFVQRRFGSTAFISPGCGRWELTVVRIEDKRLAVSAFREPEPTNETDAIADMVQSLPAHIRPTRWLMPPLKEHPSHLPQIDRACLSQRVGCAIEENEHWSREAAWGAAWFASAMFPSTTPTRHDLLPQIDRISPRSIGLLGTNSSGSWFWRRLVTAASPTNERQFYLRIHAGREPVLLLASMHPGDNGREWTTVPKAGHHLYLWHDETVATRIHAPPKYCQRPETDDATDTLKLTLTHDGGGLRVKTASIQARGDKT